MNTSTRLCTNHVPCWWSLWNYKSNGGDINNLLLSPQTCIARNGWVGYDHILPGGSEAVWNQISLKNCGDLNIGWRKPGPANVSDIPCNPIQCLCSPLFRLKTSFSPNFSPVSVNLPMCFIPFLFFYSLVWAVPSACLHYEELWLPHQVWTVPEGSIKSTPLVSFCTCCWRTRKCTPC